MSALSLAGCSGSKGGDTTCADYKEMSSKEQTSVIKAFYAEKGQSDPANGTVLLAQQSAKLYCATAGHDSSPIRNIDG